MQDFFGPAHILSDTAASARYLRHELAETTVFGGPLYEQTGFRGNFYRVNLSLIKDSVIPFDVYFNAFVEGTQEIAPLEGEEWMEMWTRVDSLIETHGYQFHAMDSDRRELADQFATGNYVVHHSRQYNNSSNFHYRIISREKFENRILPLIHTSYPSDYQ